MDLYDMVRVLLLSGVLLASFYSLYLGLSVFGRRRDETGWIFLLLSTLVGTYLLMYFLFSMILFARSPSGRVELSATDILPVMDELMYIPLLFIPALFLDFVLLYFIPGYRSYRYRKHLYFIYTVPAYVISVLIISALLDGSTLVRNGWFMDATGYYSDRTLYYHVISAYNYALYLVSAGIIGAYVVFYRDRGKGVAGFYILLSLVVGILLDALETWWGYQWPLELTVFSFFIVLLGVSLAIRRERFLLMTDMIPHDGGDTGGSVPGGVVHVDENHGAEVINTLSSSGQASLFIVSRDSEWPAEGSFNTVRVGIGSGGYESLDLGSWSDREILLSVIENFREGRGGAVVVDLRIFENMPDRAIAPLISRLKDLTASGGTVFLIGNASGSGPRRAVDMLLETNEITGTP